MRKWESEKHKSWSMPAEGFKGHVATGGSLLENAGKWGTTREQLTDYEKKVRKPRAGDADLWFKMWEELHELVKRGILVEEAHVKAHRAKKKKR